MRNADRSAQVRGFTYLSIFRMLILFLLAMAAGFYLYAQYQDNKPDSLNLAKYRRTYNTLLDCADVFGKHIHSQETLGRALALQLETRDDIRDAEQVRAILNQALENAPPYIQGVGTYMRGGGNAPQTYNFVTRGVMMQEMARDSMGDQMRSLGREPGEEGTSPSMPGRTFAWGLLSNPPSRDESRFAALLAVSVGGAFPGDVLVRADIGWLPDLLAEIHAASGEFAVCVTPDGSALWLENDRLVYNHDYGPGEELPGNGVIERALVNARGDETDAQPEFIEAEIIGSGWMLLVHNPATANGQPVSLTVAALFFSVAAAALAGEVAIAFLRPKFRRRHKSSRTALRLKAPALKKEEGAGIRRLLRQANRYLFRYRMTDPEQERIDSELRVARQIQFSLVPLSFPAYSEWREFDLYSVLHPAREVGGDYYDFFMPDSNRLIMSVGDVSGKGVPAALYMAVCRTAFRTLAHQATLPGELLTNLNDMLVRDSQSGLYVTMTCFFVDLPTGKCQYSLAGHPAPLLYSPFLKQSDFIDSPREMFMGVKAGLHFPTGEMQLDPGDTLLFYSDGVSEARNEDGDDLDYEGLRNLFTGLTGMSNNCRELVERLESYIRDFVGTREQEDDITLMAFRYWGPGGQKMRKRRGHTTGKVHAF